MIVQITGTNGSGKSTLVRAFMDECHDIYTIYEDKAEAKEGRRIVGYKVGLKGVNDPIRILGPYVTGTGGVDNFKTVIETYDRVKKAAMHGHVLFEGAGISQNQTRGPAMLEEMNGARYTIVFLTTPYGVCLKSIDERRALKGKGKLLDDRNIKINHVRANNYTARMREVGARVVRTDRDGALEELIGLFRS